MAKITYVKEVANVEKTSELIKKTMLNRYGGESKREIKQFELKDLNCGLWSLVICIGLIDDEGTMASLYCRDYRHYMIYPGGGVKLVSGENGMGSPYKVQYGRQAIYYPACKTRKKT